MTESTVPAIKSMWITNWLEIEDTNRYIVCPINLRDTGEYYLGAPIGFYQGWQVKRLQEKCYAVLLSPEFHFPVVAPVELLILDK